MGENSPLSQTTLWFPCPPPLMWRKAHILVVVFFFFFSLWKFANIGLNVSLRSRVFCIFAPWIVRPVPVYICASSRLPHQTVFVCLAARCYWLGSPWRHRPSPLETNSLPLPEISWLSKDWLPVSPCVGAFSRLSQRCCGSEVSHTHTRSRLICEMCEDHRLVETECRLRCESWRCQPSHTQ